MGYKNTVDHGLPGVKSAKDERGSAGRWRPRRPGDRVAFVTSSYGALAPSYPHEMMYPGYSGTVRDVGLIYTVIELDGGGLAKFPNGIVLNALSLHQLPGAARAARVRMTFPQSIPVTTV
jgi:small-conductance mechanosensitive channel